MGGEWPGAVPKTRACGSACNGPRTPSRVAHVLSGSAEDLRDGRFCLDLLSLYQQAWNPPFLDLYASGGFGVRNTDGEWNDARQGMTGPARLRANAHLRPERHSKTSRAPSRCGTTIRGCSAASILSPCEGIEFAPEGAIAVASTPAALLAASPQRAHHHVNAAAGRVEAGLVCNFAVRGFGHDPPGVRLMGIMLAHFTPGKRNGRRRPQMEHKHPVRNWRSLAAHEPAPSACDQRLNASEGLVVARPD
jgi:hypothetical protein